METSLNFYVGQFLQPGAGGGRRRDVPPHPPELAGKLGYLVTIAEDGAKAWNILQEEPPPQLLILDWMMRR